MSCGSADHDDRSVCVAARPRPGGRAVCCLLTGRLSATRFEAAKPPHNWPGASPAMVGTNISRGSRSWTLRPGLFPSRNTIGFVPAGARALSKRRLKPVSARHSIREGDA